MGKKVEKETRKGRNEAKNGWMDRKDKQGMLKDRGEEEEKDDNEEGSG